MRSWELTINAYVFCYRHISMILRVHVFFICLSSL